MQLYIGRWSGGSELLDTARTQARPKARHLWTKAKRRISGSGAAGTAAIAEMKVA